MVVQSFCPMRASAIVATLTRTMSAALVTIGHLHLGQTVCQLNTHTNTNSPLLIEEG